MEATRKAIETTGVIDAQRQLVLDEPLPVAGPTPVRVIILLAAEDEIEEAEEDIYNLEDGRPFNDQG